MPTAFLKLFLLIATFYATLLFLGWGITRILVPNTKHALAYAPWMGIAQTGLLLIFLAWAGFSVRQVFYVPPALSAALLLSQYFLRTNQERFSILSKRTAAILVATLLAGFIFALPSISRDGQTLTSFTLGNNDILDYSLSANHLTNHNFKPYVRPFGKDPENPSASIAERVTSWQVPSTRWLGVFFLSFLSCFYQLDPTVLFSPFLCFLLALILPLLHIFAENILKLSGVGHLGLLLAILNPHILFIAYHAFLPQILATGFMIGYFTLLSRYAKNSNPSWREAAFLSLWSAAILTAYLEVFTFVAIATVLYLSTLAFTKEIAVKKALALGARWLALSAILAPYQVALFISIILFHSGMAGGGWDVSQKYYLFLTQLGAYQYDSQWILPFQNFEWIGNVIIIILMLIGGRHASEPWLMLAIAAPFILSGFTSYRNHWNYRYFKNLTYIYFLPPLLIGAALMRLRYTKVWNSVGVLFVTSILLFAALNSYFRLRSTFAGAYRVPQSLTALQSLNEMPELIDLYAPGLEFQESLWVGYFLRDKNLFLDALNPYLRNSVRTTETAWVGPVLSKHLLEKQSDDAVPQRFGAYYFYEKASL